ncbi:MAG: DUF6776 family protein [Gammaproteobacteria bacterium]
MQSQKRDNHRQRLLVLICILLVVSIGGWLLFDYGKWRIIYQEMSEAIMQKSQMDSKPAQLHIELEKELLELRSKVTILDRTAQVDKAAQDEVRKVILALEKENQDLRQELGFYENIIESTSSGRGLKIQGFRLEPSNDKQRYQFELILTRIVKGGRVADGDVSIVLVGNDKNGKVDYDLKELLVGGNKSLHFEIKHFKRIDGVFTLPEDFVPDTIKVIVQPNEAEAASIEKFFEWLDIIV